MTHTHTYTHSHTHNDTHAQKTHTHTQRHTQKTRNYKAPSCWQSCIHKTSRRQTYSPLIQSQHFKTFFSESNVVKNKLKCLLWQTYPALIVDCVTARLLTKSAKDYKLLYSDRLSNILICKKSNKDKHSSFFTRRITYNDKKSNTLYHCAENFEFAHM